MGWVCLYRLGYAPMSRILLSWGLGGISIWLWWFEIDYYYHI